MSIINKYTFQFFTEKSYFVQPTQDSVRGRFLMVNGWGQNQQSTLPFRLFKTASMQCEKLSSSAGFANFVCYC